MCNDYARELEIGRVVKLLKELENVPPVEHWDKGQIPNDAGPTKHIKISDRGLIVRISDGKLRPEMLTWAWKGPGGKPVFNFKSEGRDFSKSNRLLILATGFYEYTASAGPRVKLKDQHFFQLGGHDWFWIAGLEKQGCFSMLTTSPGPDMKPYHDRQICVLEPKDGQAWLKLSVPEAQLLRPLPLGSLSVKTLRRDGKAPPS
jgi:putative SOS response-associated peptidase YedK